MRLSPLVFVGFMWLCIMRQCIFYYSYFSNSGREITDYLGEMIDLWDLTEEMKTIMTSNQERYREMLLDYERHTQNFSERLSNELSSVELEYASALKSFKRDIF